MTTSAHSPEHGTWKMRFMAAKLAKSIRHEPEIITDDEGHTVKRYPPMYAEGYIWQPNARPKRGIL